MDTELWNRTWTGIQNISFLQTIELIFGKDNLTFTQGYVCAYYRDGSITHSNNLETHHMSVAKTPKYLYDIIYSKNIQIFF